MAKNRSRDRQREARWRRIIRDQGRSGLGVREFCRKGKLTETAFYFWRRELLRRDGQRRQQKHDRAERLSDEALPKSEEQLPTTTTAAPAFVAVRVAARDVQADGGSMEAGRIEIELPDGRRVHVGAPVDRQALSDVLAVMEGSRC